jgi:hypothetical protein
VKQPSVTRKHGSREAEDIKKTSGDLPSFLDLFRPSVPLVSYSFPLADLVFSNWFAHPRTLFTLTLFEQFVNLYIKRVSFPFG